jgi:lipoprotein-anchoring transpeptidase ErfK/SrfK
MLGKGNKRAEPYAMRKNIPANVPDLSRRAFVIGLPLFAAGCVSTDYGSRTDSGHNIAAVDTTLIGPGLMRAEVPWTGKEKPGTVVVNIKQRRLFVVESGGRAIRYGIGVGRSQGANFRGTGVVGRKEKWPYWTPTGNMMAAIPEYRAYARGLPGGEENPLGPRALYLYRDGKDTMFRLHGTIEPDTIGQAVSSGCIRLFNQDIIDLYDRVPIGAQVVVRS